MTFSRLSILALLTVTLLAVTTYGRSRPAIDHNNYGLQIEPNTAKLGFVRGGIKKIKTNIFKHKQNIKYGMVDWMKSKLGLSSINDSSDLTEVQQLMFDYSEFPVEEQFGDNLNTEISEIYTTTVSSNYDDLIY